MALEFVTQRRQQYSRSSISEQLYNTWSPYMFGDNESVVKNGSILQDVLWVQLASKHNKDNPVKDLTSAAACAMRATVHGVTQVYSISTCLLL